MRVRRSFLNWGVFLIFLGLVPLAVQLGAISSAASGDVIRLWPFLLIGIGFGLILRFSRFEATGGVIVAGTAGLLFGAFLAGGVPSAAAACGSGVSTAAPVTQGGSFTDSSAEVSVELTCADLQLGTTANQEWSVEVSGSGTPVVTADDGSLALRSADRRFFMFGGDSREKWRAHVAGAIPLSLQATLNGSTGAIDLGAATLESANVTFKASDLQLRLPDGTSDSARLNGTFNASSVRVTLGNADLTAGLTINASSLTLCAAPGVGLSISYSGTLSSDNFEEAGLVGSDGRWQSPGFDDAASQVELQMTANVSSASLNPESECP